MAILPPTNGPVISGFVPSAFSAGRATSGIAVTAVADGIKEKATGDHVELSPEGREQSQGDKPLSKSETIPAPQSPTGEQDLNPEQQQQLRELKDRDREVRTHEQAHLSAAGQYAAGSASFTYQSGPDGGRYAVGGEVPIDISKEPTPEATIQKMETIRAAALAPAEPSAADRQIAAQAALTAAKAQQDLIMMRKEQELRSHDVSPDGRGGTDTGAAGSSRGREYPGGFTVSAMISAYTAMQSLG